MARGGAFGLKRAPNSAVSPPDPPKPNPPLLSTPDFLLPLSGSRAQSISLLHAEVDGVFCSLVGNDVAKTWFFAWDRACIVTIRMGSGGKADAEGCEEKYG